MENLNKKDFQPESVIDKALKDTKILAQLIDNLLVKNDTVRYNSHKILLLISKDYPEILYPRWDFFVDLLKSDNNFQKVIGIQILANLTKVDEPNKFEDIFDTYCDLLDAKSVMTAAHLAANIGKIAKMKPKLRPKLTEVLFNVNKTHHESTRKNMIIASVIESFFEYFDDSKRKEEIIKFVKAQLNSTSPKTKKIAKKFLNEFE